jgi:RND family efflux transporter MFP subunit
MQAIFRIFLILSVLLFPVLASAQRGDAPPARVRVAEVAEKERAENAGFVGLVYFDRVSGLSAEVAGQVETSEYRAGDTVNADEVLATLNTDFLDKDIALEKAQIEQVNVRIKKAEKNLRRYRDLFRQEAASEIDYDNLNFDYQELVQQRAVIRQRLAKIELQREKCVIRSPFDAVILEKNVEPGEWVNPGGMLYRLGASSDVFVKVPVAENLFPYAQKARNVEVVLNAYDRRVSGEVIGLLPEAEAQTKNILLKVRLGALSDIGVSVAENMSATVFLPVSETKTLRVFPRDALVKDRGNNVVYVVEDGKAAVKPVNVVAYMGTEVGVDNENIEPGMSVVVDGNERLNPGQPVQIAEEN